VKRGEQTGQGFEPVETITIERDDGGKGLSGSRCRLDDELDALAVTEIVEKDVCAVVSATIGSLERRRQFGVPKQARGR